MRELGLGPTASARRGEGGRVAVYKSKVVQRKLGVGLD